MTDKVDPKNPKIVINDGEDGPSIASEDSDVGSSSSLHWLWISLVVIVLDQLSKWWILENLRLYEVIVVNQWLNITHRVNTGAAFSMLADMPPEFFIGLGVVVSFGMAIWIWRYAADQRLVAAAFSLVIGGAIGNIVDRGRLGHVVDFIDFHIGSWHYAAFNVADIAITCGAAIMVLDIFLDFRRQRSARSK